MIFLHFYDLSRQKNFNAKEQLKENLGFYLKKEKSQIKFWRNKNGKPMVDGVNFSITHTKNWLIHAFTQAGNLGIDCEFINPNRAYLKLANRYFHPEESEMLNSLDKKEACLFFYDLWTAKEAICKAQGGRLWYYLRDNYLDGNGCMKKTIKELNIVQLRELKGFSLTIATALKQAKLKVIYV